jgi:VWFA-related protein
MLGRLVAPSLLVAAAVFILADGLPLAGRAGQIAVLVTVVADKGAPLLDLEPADFIVKEDGKGRTVVDARLAKDPLSIALLIDTTKPPPGGQPTQNLRKAASVFVRTVHAVTPEAQIALGEFAGVSVTSVEFTNKTDELENAIMKLYPNQQATAVLLDALIDAGKKMAARPAPRRAIVTVDFPSPEGSAERAMQEAADSITNSGATLWAVSIRGSGTTDPRREEVLNRMTKANGGMRFSSLDVSGLEGILKTVAASLTSQYLVTFERPGDGAVKTTTFATAAGHKVLPTPFMR